MNGTVVFFTAKVKFLRPKILQLLLNADSAGFYADVLALYICISVDLDSSGQTAATNVYVASWSTLTQTYCPRGRDCIKRKCHGSSFLELEASSCPQQVVRVGLVDFGERHDTRQHYTAADRRPTNQVKAWQAEYIRHPRSILSRMSGVSAKMLRGNCSRGIPALPTLMFTHYRPSEDRCNSSHVAQVSAIFTTPRRIKVADTLWQHRFGVPAKL